MILFLQPNVPLFQHSILPFRRYKQVAIKKPVFSRRLIRA
jgi:hypothetical protein